MGKTNVAEEVNSDVKIVTKKKIKKNKNKKKKHLNTDIKISTPEGKSSKSEPSFATDPDEENLTIEILKQLGGTEDDLKLIENIEGGDKDEDLTEETASELKNLVKSLNFSKFGSDTFLADDKDFDEALADEKPSTSKVTVKDPVIKTKSEDTGKDEEADEEEEEAPMLPDFLFVKDKPSERTYCVVKPGEKESSNDIKRKHILSFR